MISSEIALNNAFEILQKDVKKLGARISALEKAVGNSITSSELAMTEGLLRNDLTSLGTTVTQIEEKLTKINLPEDTRYYLDKTEIESFRSNLQKLIVMIADLEEMQKNIISYTSNLSNTLR